MVVLPRKSQAELTAFIGLRFHADAATMAFRHALRKVEPVTWTPTARFVELEAEVEDLGRVAGVDADAVVAHADAIELTVARRLDGDHALAFRVIVEEQRVGDQRGDRLADFFRI